MNNQLAINELTEIRARIDAALKRLTEQQPKPLPFWRSGGDLSGTSLQHYVEASYKDLVALLGEPSDSDGYKVSTEWNLTHEESGEPIALYDYKETHLYDPDLPSVEKFRALDSYEWHIGARSKQVARNFAAALEEAISKRREI